MDRVAVQSTDDAVFLGEIERFIQNDYALLIDELRKQQGFPGVCYTASQIVSSFFKVAYGREISIVCGTFGDNHLFHTWLNVEGKIFDLTLFQFHQGRLAKKEYERMPVSKLIRHIEDCQKGFIFSADHPTSMFYKELVHVQPEYLGFGHEGIGFKDFMSQILVSDAYRYSDWFHGVVVSSGERFKNWLTRNGKRVTKRFFTKYAIVNMN